MSTKARLIAFYLPQFHPIPENNAWWGTGFTEWTNVSKARPLFKGHYQPHLPADLGFYDLRLPEARIAQAELAREYGIHGFCYYHYWFNGRRILERPFTEVLASGNPDFPFCLCWANENWTRTWDGGADNILLRQRYSDEDDLAHIHSLLPALRDSRYIRIKGKALILVYRTEILPDPKRTVDIWRSEACKAGAGDLYLVRVESFTSGMEPASIGFDAAVEFAPDWHNKGNITQRGLFSKLMTYLGLKSMNCLKHQIYEYSSLVDAMLGKELPTYPFYRCVCPSFDNSPRRKTDSVVFHNSTPELYFRWLNEVVEWTSCNHSPEERLVFVNAWNEWGEGNHLEPDLRWGKQYLEKTRQAINRCN
ncbi:glycoside hydrolase family 99-like domain-containing protein [Pelobacter propionicus]|uniref:Polysaccharide biosynthesis protein n=1 Tax=Pelobacter propionicus (strain DSM 2379 / NBRC 103807 / OttBd1) TaxID=338966 RepID=A1AQU3_PELPD|nr:glycoside hydrolase family 99-like domain-containing protein [Pelobacter propionicus]ABK99713.1 polysaccharide biosynthesis protein [Pelobacter propionicus DSM 2379]